MISGSVGDELVVRAGAKIEIFNGTPFTMDVGDTVKYIGAVGPVERSQVLGGALALLHLISFDEPFGLSLVESLACGTPVIAFGRGSMPEIIKHGETGYIVADTDAAVEAVALVASLNRSVCRKDAAKRFSHTRMASDYVHVYREILKLEADDEP
jgi:glycosyltransferase involved in cell wall biosynthesis